MTVNTNYMVFKTTIRTKQQQCFSISNPSVLECNEGEITVPTRKCNGIFSININMYNKFASYLCLIALFSQNEISYLQRKPDKYLLYYIHILCINYQIYI